MAKFKIFAPREKVTGPVISATISKTGAQFYITDAKVGEWGKELIVEIVGTDEQVDDAVSSLERSGAKISRYGEKAFFDRDTCVDCGACYTLCPWFAIEIPPDWEIRHLPDKCVEGCSLCMACCPVNAITLREIESG